MPDLALKYEFDDNTKSELDLTTISTSPLSLPSINISATPSISNFQVLSPSLLCVSSLKDLSRLSLHGSSSSTLQDSPIVPHRSLSISLASSLSSSSSNYINDNLENSERPDSTNIKLVNDNSKVTIDDNTLEKEVENTLDGSEVHQQVRASFGSLAGVFEIVPSIRFPRKRSVFFSKIPFFERFKTSEEPGTRRLKPFEIYKFADKLDICLMIIGAIAALGVGACYPLMLFIYQQVLNSFLNFDKLNDNTTVINSTECITSLNNTNTTSPTAAIRNIIKYYVILGCVSMLLYWIAWSTWIVTAERQVRRIRYALFRNILRQEIAWFDVHNTGELSNRLIDDLDKIKDGMSEKVPDFIALFGRMLGTLIYGLVIGWKLSLVYLSVSPLIILTFNLTIKIIVKYTIKEVKAFASASSVVQEVLQNIRTVTAFHGQKKEQERFANNLIEAKTIGIKKGIYVGLCQGITTIFMYSAFAILAWYGPYLARTECSHYSGGTVIIVFFASVTTTMCIAQFIPNIQNFAEAAGSGIYVFDIIERKTKIDASSNEGDKPQTITGDIEFNNVIFAYPAREETLVLSKLSFKIPSGRTVALVGSSGSGKSTIIQLIQRFYDSDYGEILLDGKDIKTLNVAWLRSHIGIVSQEPVLFTGSIEDNIRFGKQDATDEEVINAAKMANAHDFIMSLPDNYKTTSGDKLSGGQKQRVAIARALISNPKILLLDEATSALDNTSERIVQDALDKAKQGRTTIIIAHRLSTIRNADLIIGLEHGEVIENGTHDELMEQKGLYYELVTAQSEKDKDNEDDLDSDTEENDNKDEHLLLTQSLANRRLSKQSIISIGNSDAYDENADETLNDRSAKNKFFRTPFLYKISKFNTPEWHWILLGTLVSLAFGTTQPFFGLIFSNLYSSFAETDVHAQEQLTRNYAIISFFIGLGGGISQFLISLSFAKSGEALTMRMRKLTFAAILRQEIGYFDHESNTSGALVTRLSSDASALKGLTGVRVGIILQSISCTVTGLIIGFFASWKLTLVVLCFSPIMLLASKIRSPKVVQAEQSKDRDLYLQQGGQHATQAIEHIRTVVALHQENHFINLYENSFNQEFKKQMFHMPLLASGIALSGSVIYFLHSACFGYGSRLVDDGEIQFSQMYRVFAVITMAIFSVGRSMAMIPDYSKAKAAAVRIMELHKRQSKLDPNDESGIILKNVVGDIEFHDVDFRYPSRPSVRVLRNFSLKCSSGNTTALVGPSGTGKSTTIALLQRFYDPSKGKVLLDGHDIKILNIRWLRSLMGLVQQEPVLFNLPIRDNIAYGDNNQQVTQDQIETAAQMANIHDLIISLPQGYDTLCGAKGNQLSGGQKQRIAIARSLIRNPKILLLDEATSALDNKSEKVVQDALDEARTGRTCLTIAHRLSTIKNSDKISVVNRGKITEEGTHEELLRQKGIYAKLALAQQRSPE